MSDRLRELQRQRALLQEHLAWLDREIIAAQGTVPSGNISPPSTAAPAIRAVPKPVVFGDAAAAERAAEEIISQYKQEEQSLHRSVKRGCFFYFFIALAILGIGVFALYLFRTQR